VDFEFESWWGEMIDNKIAIYVTSPLVRHSL